MTRKVEEVKLGGIAPESLFLERSRVSNRSKLPMLSGVFPVKWFMDKFKMTSLERFVISGISPDKLL